ncbi:universal stress protein [uncultured Lutibacter sp.]|uniref:universal stress protein n=1 Tax=uncultured Lutibacter sp. TaxID=437739 RepID=UPI002615E48F|nr:universal stress protein [uncultured Lutibacter sp.]
MKNILIPTDFSDNSWNAIEYALNFYKNIPCNFYLLNVSLISNYPVGDSAIILSNTLVENKLLQQSKTALKTLVKKIKKSFSNTNHNFYKIYKYDFFIDAIRSVIEDKKIELIIMGTKGASGLSEVIVGSNTGDLITQVHCPVLIIPENAVFKTPKEIAFPTDYNIYYQTKVLKTISEFTKLYDSAIRILHITKKNEHLTDFQLDNKEFLNDYFLDEKHSFHRLTNNKIENGIQCFVESRDTNLIIMVAKNLNLFQRILFKPTVEEISYHVEIPFLVLHE